MTLEAADFRYGKRTLSVVFCLGVVTGCADAPILFRGVASVSDLKPDERVVIGQIQYTKGDLSKSLPGSYKTSWPRFSYDLWHVQPPQYDKPLRPPPFDGRGGVFAFRVKRQPVYLESIMAETSELMVNRALWSIPITLKLPTTPATCAFVGTIIVDITGEVPGMPSGWVAPRTPTTTSSWVKVTVLDTYDRDRAALASYVAGCDLQRALAVRPSDQEVEALIASRRGALEAEQAQRPAETGRLQKH